MPSSSTEQIDLDLFGMTCTSCASRIERKLNRLPGANATVNYALEEATISYDPNALDIDKIVDAVRQAGYDAVKKDKAGPTPKTHHPTWPLAISAALSAILLGSDLSIWSISRPIALLLAAVVVLLVGRDFLVTAIRDLGHLTGGMDSLVSLGFVTAFVWSTAVTFAGLGHEPIFFDAAAIVPTVIYLGRWIEDRAKTVARSDLNDLQAQILGDVMIKRQGVEMIVPASEILREDVVTVRPGQVVPTDITVTIGESTVDTAIITGESDPTPVAPGINVLAGSLNRDQLLEGVATTSAQRSFLSQLTLQVAQAQARKANLERISDRISRVFVPIVILIAIATFLAWLAEGSATRALVAAIAVLVVACPCSLGLATPIAFLVATSRAARSGILIQSPTVLEQVPKIDTVFLDKTGTLTDATLSFDHLPAQLSPIERERIAAIAQASTHPVARALGTLSTTQLSVEAVKELPGSGMVGTVDGHTITIATPQFFNIQTSDGPRTVACQIDDQPPMIFTLRETLRDGATDLVQALRDNGIQIVMLTGDRLNNAEPLARALGIETIRANVQPAEKSAAIRDAQALGKRVAMVGDGINDAAALAQADLGIALAGGTDIAKASADITILGDDILKVPGAIGLARATLRNIHQNFAWAIGYNAVAITLAAVGILNPMLAAALMASSSLIVVTNALRLRRWHL
ncbi:heavy metal translocating P-type ATPase [Ferrimicrobium acidiphilum]|uniref:heavy metal translocating P-type ATPase n=1 Tax=Ferrimicrobium acidiphilum TaxID=121039 RepID=UPI0023F3CCF9|nr:cation-translocating P-type ATPase [Ferrimicrobium acidiphilum]